MAENDKSMTPVGDPGWIGRFIESVKDLPSWLLTGLAVAADLLLLVPSLSSGLSPEIKSWLIVFAVLFTALAIFKWFSVGVDAWHASRNAAKAKKTFHLSPVTQHWYWSVAKQADDSMVTQISADFLVKNQSTASIGLVGCRLIKPVIKGEVLNDSVLVRAERENIYGSAHVSGHRIPAGGALPARATLMLRGVPKQTQGGPMMVTLGVKDDDGNEQRVRVLCKGIPAPNTNPMPTSPEALYLIADPLVKEVVSVLQSELSRYDKCGRSAGGLGSIHIVYRGVPLIGMGTESWGANSAVNQEIADDPEAAELRSDNLDVLVAYHARLHRDDERLQFVSTLIERIEPEQGYLRVSYFIVCVLWKVGELGVALGQAQSSLPQGEIKEFGLSNVLMLLNGLLRYRYPDFTPDMLDQIERFVHGLAEHPFQIPQKIAAIRARRLGG